MFFRKPTKSYTMTIYMKSGNAIVLDQVTEYDIGNNGNEIVKLAVGQSGGTQLLVKTTDLTQIEAITVKIN